MNETKKYNKKYGKGGNQNRRNKREYKNSTQEKKFGNEGSSNGRYSDTVPTHNDPSWYNRFSSLVRDSATLPFSNPLGELLDATDFGATSFSANSERNIRYASVPGIMTFQCIDVPGVSRDGASPLNIAARSLYNFVRHANSGSSTYNSSDLMQYVYAVDSAYTLWAHLVRAYGILTTYSYSNRYLGARLFNTMGLGDFNEYCDRMADFRALINQFAVRIGSLCVPSDMSLVTRHIWMYGNLFTDAPSTKAQIYAFVPSHGWRYAEVEDERGGLLKPVSFSCGNLEEVNELINSIIIPLVTSESLMNMGGDIRKAFGESALMTIASIPEIVDLKLSYDERACMEFQNVNITPLSNIDNIEILADANTNTVIFDPVCDSPIYWSQPTQNRLLNIRLESPSADDVMKATRLMTFANRVDSTHIDSCGTELVHDIVIWTYQNISGDIYDTTGASLRTQLTNGLSVSNVDALDKFDFRPNLMNYETFTVNGELGVSLSFSGDLSNYTTVSNLDLHRMHEAALFSELWNPNMGTFMKD